MLRLVVILSGAATMGLQMCAVRLLAPWVGASSVVWATIIGLSLLAMSLGYVLGGRLADRRVDGHTLALTLGCAALLVATVPLVAPHAVPHVGTAAAYGVLFLAPAVLLGATPPYAIRLAVGEVAGTGRTAGGLYALSTIGSIVGTLLTALVLVQWIGTRATLWSIAGAVLLAAIAASRVRARVPGSPSRAVTHAAGGVIALRLAAAIVLLEGMALMATEMSAARLVAPFFGASQAVWAVLIAVVMGSIALGSRLGGRLADRRPALRALVVLLAVAACAVALLPFVAAPVMRLSIGDIQDEAVAPVVATFLATMALLVVPMTLLGMVPPWVLRLAVPDVEHAGRTAGRMYALSTAGALVGTFASVLWLIPSIGTRHAMLLFAGALAVLVALLGRRTPIAAAPLVLVVALAFAPTGLIKPQPGTHVLEERESRYQFIQVLGEDHDRRELQLNEGWAVHSVWNRDSVLTGGYWDAFLVVPALLPVERRTVHVPDAANEFIETEVHHPRGASADGHPDLLVIGNAAGTMRRALHELAPEVHVTSVELDPDVTEVGRRWFGSRGTVETADGRPFLMTTDEHFDVVHVDAFRQPYIPFYLTTREFFETVRGRLRDGGIVSVNVGSTPGDRRITRAIAATMRDVFPTVVRYRAEDFNDVLVGIDDPHVTLDELRERIAASDIPQAASGRDRGDLQRRFDDFASEMVEVEPDPAHVLTDDRAPVEWMTDRMIFGAAR